MKKILFFVFIIFYLLHYCQINTKNLTGDWILIHKELADGSKFFSQTPTVNPHTIYYFNKGSYFTKDYVTDSDSFINFSFKIKDSIIIHDNSPQFKIEKLTSDELILLDINERKIDKTFGRYYLKRYESVRNNDLEKFADKELLISTPALSPYPKKYIFENEFKEDSDQIFKTKGYLFFDIESKSLNAILTDLSSISPESKKKLTKILNESYGMWDFSKVANFKKIKMPFVAICYKLKVNNNNLTNISIGYNITEYDEIVLPIDTQKIIDAENHYTLALKCFEKQDYNCSAENFKKSFLENKYNLDAHYNYASINFYLGKKDLACNKWKELVEWGQKEAEKLYTRNNCESIK